MLEELLDGQRDQLLHDAWSVRAIFGSTSGPWRRAGFATRVLARAAGAELARLPAIRSDPLDEAHWILAEQSRLLNHVAVEERSVRALFGELGQLRPSQQAAVRRLLRFRSAHRLHPQGGPASNLLLIAILAAGLAAARDTESMRAVFARLPADVREVLPSERASILILDAEVRERLDERSLALDLAFRIGGRPR
ncbi:MAG TPA: hypothetical protein VN033_12115 [Vulgatibacter sp.]|nr:hypothetical protein [Vulgatibacter sp.]